MTHSVRFNGNNILFDFIQLDLSGNINEPEFLNKLYYQFDLADASAVALLPSNLVKGVFWYSIRNNDLDESDNQFTIVSDNWPQLNYSQALVTPETSISKAVINTPIYEDFVRSIIRDIIGIGLNCLFSNLEEMKHNVKQLDIQFDQLIRYIMNSTSLASSYLFNSFIHQDANDDRRNNFMNQIIQKQNDYDSMYDVAFYYYTQNSYFYPLYLSQEKGSRIELDSIVFYSPHLIVSTFLETAGLFDYKQYINPYFPIDFLKDDIITIRLNYQHSQEKIYDKTINPRSYMLYLKLTD
jgi:hypothetical protein